MLRRFLHSAGVYVGVAAESDEERRRRSVARPVSWRRRLASTVAVSVLAGVGWGLWQGSVRSGVAFAVFTGVGLVATRMFEDRQDARDREADRG